MTRPGRSARRVDTATMGPAADLARLHEWLAAPGRPLTWVFTGDSITQGVKWPGRERAYPELAQERIRWELQRRRDLIVNSGVSGDTAPGLLADLTWRVLRFHPDVVSLMIGMNDAAAGPPGRTRFEAALNELLRLIREGGALPLLHRTNPVDPESAARHSHADLGAYNEIIARVANEHGVVLIDHWSRWREARPDPAALREWLGDPVHPNGAGQRQLAIGFFHAMGCFDPTAPTCQA